MPKQILQPTYEFPSNFPGRNIKAPQSDASTVFIVGTGWYFPRAVTALVAAGAKVVAYEMDEKKVGRGQIGNTFTDEIFNFVDVHESALMPKFTEAQLTRLPSVLKEIQQEAGYQQLMKKHGSIEAIKNDADITPWSEKVIKYDTLASSMRYQNWESLRSKRR